ncbi:MAG: PKD domain-containing protein [Bacteroidales bacterium]|nr:PKD domain-containing protein [Bacteroidales bacterium]
MKKLLLFLLLLSGSLSLLAEKGYQVSFDQPSNDIYQLNFTLEEYGIDQISIDGVTYSRLVFDGSVFTQLKGFAELPFVNASVQLPANKNVTLKLIEGDFEDYVLDFPMLPSRGVIYRDQDPSTVPYVISPSSMRDAWYPQNLATNVDPFIIKDVRGTTVYVYPFRYNAVTKVLRVYKNLTVQLVENNTPATNPLTVQSEKILREMDGVYRSIFINYDSGKDPLTIGEYGDILVISTDRDIEAIQPYIDWKLEKGYNISLEVVATGTNVKTLIQQAYNANNNLLYVQLVGDWADIKSDLMSGYAPMDPQLGCVVGSDNYPDITVGRFSANNPSHVTIQVDKVINYEKNPQMGEDWYKSAIGIASNQGPGDDNELDYEHIDVIYDNRLSQFTYDNFTQIYDPSANTTMVKNAVEAGASIINYCGHGSATSWGSSGFSNSNVSTLTNGDMLPIIFSVACNNGNFHDAGDCFAEAWVKKSGGGAVMFLGATISQPWDPPMRGEDYFNDVLVGGYNYSAYPGQNGINNEEQRTTLGAMVFNGLVLMTTESGGSSDWETAKTWHIFGDAAMQPRTDEPANLNLSNNVILVGVPFSTIITGPDGAVEGAMVCISQEDAYFSAVTDASGSVSIDNTLSPGMAKLVVTGFNTETIYEEVTVVPPGGAWIIVNNCEVNDAGGNNNGQADYGETVLLDVAAENVGDDDATGVMATLMSSDPYITITDDSHTFGDIAAGTVVDGEGAFEIEIAENTPDGYSAMFEVEFTDGNKSLWTSTMTIILHAPVIEMGDYTIDDQSGNGNGKIDPGETVEINVGIMNDGSSAAYNVTGEIICADPYITIETVSSEYGDIDAGSSVSESFVVMASESTPTGHAVTFNFEIGADMGISGMGSFIEVVGQIPVLVIDLDGNASSGPEMVQAMDDNGVVAEYVTSMPDDLSLYSSVFLCLGIYSDNHVLTSSEGQDLADYLNQGGALYMEGGDTWYFDSQTAVHNMFNINGTEDGSSDMGTVQGQAGTFTEGMSFNYSGENNWMDHIDPVGSAFTILKNQSPSYGTGVAYDAGDYKTIGTSHEFGGLNDGASPSTKAELMAEFLNFFGITGQDMLAYFMADVTEVCEGEMVSYVDYSTGNVTSWSWEFPGGDPESSTEQNPEVTYNTAGVYDVILTVSDGSNSNTYTRTDYITVNICTGMDELTEAGLSVYPNPSNGLFNVEFSSDVEENVNIKVINSLSSVVFEKNNIFVDGIYKATIDLSELYKGLYFLVIENCQGRTVNRIIIR